MILKSFKGAHGIDLSYLKVKKRLILSWCSESFYKVGKKFINKIYWLNVTLYRIIHHSSINKISSYLFSLHKSLMDIPFSDVIEHYSKQLSNTSHLTKFDLLNY